MADKKLIRSSIRKLRDSLPEDERSLKSAGITDNVTGTPEYKAARDVLIYVSTGSEADTTELIKMCFEDKKNVYVPKVYGKDMRLKSPGIIHNVSLYVSILSFSHTGSSDTGSIIP